MRKIQVRNIIDAGFILIIMFLLEYSYKNFIVPYFTSEGYTFSFDFLRYSLSKIILLIIIIINLLQEKFNYFISILFTILMLIPNLILYEFNPQITFTISFFIFLTILLIFFTSLVSIRTIKISYTNPNKILSISIVAFLAFIPLFFTYGTHINLKVFLFKDIYLVREQGVEKMGLITSYIYPWIVKIIFPMALILALQYKKKMLFILIFLAQLYLFAVQGHKSVFISVFLIFFFFIKDYHKQIRLILYGIISVIISARLITLFTGNILPESIFVRRVFFVPAINNYFYFDFFKEKPLFYSNSILKRFIEYPYSIKPQYLIGEKYYGATKMSVNNGFISDGYMNIGIWGIIINIIGIIIYFRLLSKINISPVFSGILIIIIFTLISSYLLTSLLTHGLLIFLLLSFIILQDTNKSFK